MHATVAATAADCNGFLELGLTESVVQALRDVGYEAPTPIQAATIPAILAGSDVLGQAQTGTGKTGAFALPILSKIDVNKPQTQAMVLVPTRELAIQVAEAFQRYATHMKGFHVLPIYGGQSYTPQLKGLKRGAHVIVGTPGRVMDHMKRGTLPLDAMTFLVLDEADEMLQMGFIDAIEWILEQSPPNRQIALFSATVPPAIRRIAQRHQRSPKEITIRSKTSTAPNIRQRYWLVSGMHKLDALTRILEVETFDAMLVFVRTKLETVELAERLEARGFEAAPLNGDIPQPQRERTIAALKSGKVDIVVATDVAARGLDVERISHVVNYDVPYDSESYIHRIGRTGRAGRSGEAILFIAPRERNMLRIIERATRQQITQMNLPSVAAVNEQRVARFKQRIADTLAEGETEAFRAIVEEFQAEHDASALDVAAALASLVQGTTPLLLPERAEAEQARGWGRRDDQRDSGPRDRGGASAGRGRYEESRGPRGARGEDIRGARSEGNGARVERGGRSEGTSDRSGSNDSRGDRDARPVSGRQYGGGDRGEVIAPNGGERAFGANRAPDRDNDSRRRGRDDQPVRDDRAGEQSAEIRGGSSNSAARPARDERPVEQAQARGADGDSRHRRDEERPVEQAAVRDVVDRPPSQPVARVEIDEVDNSDLDAFSLERDAQEQADGPVQFADEQVAVDGAPHADTAGHAVAANGDAQGDGSAPQGEERGNRLRQFANDRGASDGHNARSNRAPRDRGARGGQNTQGGDAQRALGANNGRGSHGNRGGDAESNVDANNGRGGQGNHGGDAQSDHGRGVQGAPGQQADHGARGNQSDSGADSGQGELGAQADTGARPGRRNRDDTSDVVFETFRLEVGNTHGVKPGNIVGAIANEAGLDGRHIGHVDIRDDHSFVDLPEGMPRDIFRNLKKVRVVGQELRISRVDGKPARQH